MIWLGVACAGAAGASTRFVIERVARDRFGNEFPWAPWGMNTVGSFALGAVVGLAVAQGLSLDAAAVIGTGFVGAFTIVGPLTFDSLRLALQGRRVAALVNSVGALVACTGAAALGLAITGAI
ncbi:MAG: CrcB family protein [Acidimicrobiia bacterium]|nr:CrcB family protein [Acidimicrobiia bacterium]